MSEVKVSIRRRHAELTRTAIAEAGRELFAANGYQATTIEQMAARAGVAPSTVYAVYGTKAAVLAEVRWRAVSDAGIPQLEDLAVPGDTAAQLLRRIVSAFRRLYESSPEVFAVQRSAAAVDAGLARNWDEAAAQRRNHMRRLLATVASELKDGQTVERAGDVLNALVGFETYEDLVVRCEWTPSDYEEWLATALIAVLLPKVKVAVARPGKVVEG